MTRIYTTNQKKFYFPSGLLIRSDLMQSIIQCVWSVSNKHCVTYEVQAKTCSKPLFTQKYHLYIKLILQCHIFKTSYQFTCNTQKYFDWIVRFSGPCLLWSFVMCIDITWRFFVPWSEHDETEKHFFTWYSETIKTYPKLKLIRRIFSVNSNLLSFMLGGTVVFNNSTV